MMEHGASVKRTSTGYTGRVHGKVIDGHAYVRWDCGGGCNVAVTDLEPQEQT